MSGSFAKSDLQLEAAYKSSPPCARKIYMPVQSVAFGASFHLNLQSQSPISISLVSFQRNVVKKT